MDIGEIEESYRKELETSEKDFLECVNKGANAKEAELRYKRATLNARANYSSQLVKFLKNSRKLDPTGTKKSKKERTVHFKADTSGYGIGLSTRLINRADFLTFKIGFYTRNFFRKMIPNNLLYIYYKIKIKVVRFFNKISARMQIVDNKINDLKSQIRESSKKKLHLKS